MDPVTTAALIGAGSKLAGALIPSNNNHAGRDSRQRLQEAVHASIGLKVEEAKKYGISPLYALGAPTFSPAGVSVGDDSLGRTISDMGADVSRAVAMGQTANEKALNALALQKAGAEIDLLKAQTAKIARETMSTVPFPTPSSPAVKVNAPEWSAGPHVGSTFWEANPFIGDFGQWGENRMGESEILSLIYGIPVAGADVLHNIKRAYSYLTGSGGYGSYSRPAGGVNVLRGRTAR